MFDCTDQERVSLYYTILPFLVFSALKQRIKALRKTSLNQVFIPVFHCLYLSGFPSGGLERVDPESQPLQLNHQAFGAEVHSLPSSG